MTLLDRRNHVWVCSYSRAPGQACYSFPFTARPHLCSTTGLETLLWAVNAADIKLQKVIFTLRVKRGISERVTLYLYGRLGGCKMKLVMVGMFFNVIAACTRGYRVALWDIKMTRAKV